MNSYNKLSSWSSLVCDLQHDSKSLAMGIFDQEGMLQEANEAMRLFLGVEGASLVPENRLINPTLPELLKKHVEGKVFEGILTMGNYADVSYSFQAKVFRKEKWLFVYCEADAPQLFSDNKKMSRLNQEVNNLQRQLIKEKAKLQNTLSELKETQQMLIHAEKMSALGKLVAGIAHEINNPISFVYSNIYSLEDNVNSLISAYNELQELTKDKCIGSEYDEFQSIKVRHEIDYVMEDLPDIAKETKIGIERVAKIVDDLRKFSRLDESEVKYIDLIDSIKSTLMIARSAFKEKQVEYQLIAPNKLFLECFPGQLNQAILNVIMNAVQAVDTKGHVDIELLEKQDSVQISVTDNGPGIPADVQEKIFDPFYTTKPVGSGTGLGLSIAYKIIHDLHKGSLVVKSQQGHGARFEMVIPKN